VLKKRVEPLAAAVGSEHLIACDVTDMGSIDQTFAYIKEKWGKLDFVVHSIAFADKNELKGRYVDTSMENFLNSMNISCYSFVAIAKRAAELMPDGGSIITLTYYGAEKVIPNYNVMGVAKAALEASVQYIAADLGVNNIKVNAISAGPMRTLAASGIGDFKSFLKWTEDNTPLKRCTTLEDVGGAAVYLLSSLSNGVTGEVLHVDSGYHVMGMKMLDAHDQSEA
jgi:enoyl-[acyl-carrier protein] reductase I